MSCGLSCDLSNVHSHTDIYILWPVSHSTTQKVLVLLFFVYPVTQNVCLEIFRELTQLYCLLQDVDNVQNAVNSLSVIWMYNIQNIQSTINLSRWCIQFTPVKVHSDISIYYTPKHNSSPYSKRIQSFFVVRCTFLIYIHRFSLELYRTNSKKLGPSRPKEEVLETTGNWVSPNLS